MGAHTRARARLCAVAALAASASGAAPAGGGAADAAFPVSGMTGLTAVSGVVTRDGAALEGAAVLAIAYPAGDALDVPEGGSLGTVVAGAAGTDARGRFSVALDPSALPAPYVDERGRVHLEVAITDGTREVRWMTTAVRSEHAVPIGGRAARCGAGTPRACDPGDPVYVLPAAGGSERLVVLVGTAEGRPVVPVWSTAAAETAGVSVPRQLVADLGGHPSVADANDDPAAWMTAPAGEPVTPVPGGAGWRPPAGPPPAPSTRMGAAGREARRTAVVPRSPAFSAVSGALRDGAVTAAQISAGRLAAAGRSPGPCLPRVVKRYNGREETYMGVYAWSGALATVTQADGADHTLGVGGAAGRGRWSSSGSLTLSVRAGDSHTVSRVADAWAIGTVNYGVVANGCDGRRGLVPLSLGDPIKRFARAYHPRLKAQCITLYGNSSVWDKDQARNIVIGGGVSVAGFSASAQSGYDVRSKLSFRPKKLTRLCGDKGVGVRLSAIVEAHKG
ncbi:hypothetical protein Sme01_69140 [Sphaerisporangium melleum]|uniref:Secreted protein n=1 Tax=Sphaerisporangium melleum TaxID=321316 RepID=A0A917VTI2_9ACTN|nr:hypothetical protein [Sphaerisporangium melleum]GGL12662.1 hypothetical protein GCM10007964_63390 [Sphaerisporangium melleum]GII74438.1 hypothetical protein Sme01_69140 [Sphaerisporangium melleum]